MWKVLEIADIKKKNSNTREVQTVQYKIKVMELHISDLWFNFVRRWCLRQQNQITIIAELFVILLICYSHSWKRGRVREKGKRASCKLFSWLAFLASFSNHNAIMNSEIAIFLLSNQRVLGNKTLGFQAILFST